MDFFLPDWAPNMHPMLVHFPIVLLIVAVFFDIAALIFRSRHFFMRVALILFIMGALALLLTWLSGRAAADSVMVSGLQVAL